jgi:Domain of unknown function (DUF4430)
MHRKTVIALLGAIVMALAGSGVALAATAGPSVTVQVKNGTKTLTNSTVHGEKGWITKDGTPKGKCSGNSALGALDAATHHKWAGKYDSSLGGLYVTSIDGVKPKGNNYWAFYVNGKYSSKGVCVAKLRAGERVLFKVEKG